MFKNLILYRVTKDPMVLADFAAYAFEPCGAHQEKSIGWVPPRGQEFGALVEAIAGHISYYGHESNHWQAKDMASYAYEMADAMLEARKK